MRSLGLRSVWVAGLVLSVAGAAYAQVSQGSAAAAVNPHAEVPLWAKGAPGSQGKTAPEQDEINDEGEHRVSSINKPSITPYLVRHAKGPTAAVIIAPGGGHMYLSITHEGYDVAKYLSGHGVAAFVLKYRLAHEKGSTYTVEGDALPDMQRAIRLVRSHAAEWDIDPARVGVMGFSAGGELAVLAMTHAEAENASASDPVDRMSDKPSFEGLMYPGGLTPEALTAAESKVTKDTGPAFLLCGANDRDQIALALPQLFIAMRKVGMQAELHEFAGVGHGFGLRLSQGGGVSEWPELFVDFLDTEGLLHGK